MRGTPFALVLVLLLAGCERGPGRLWSRFERMIDQRRNDPYTASRVFADGRTMQAPPEGTVSRDRVLGPPVVVTGRDGGGWAEAVPVPLDASALRRGRAHFEIVCATCHGITGEGRSPVADAMALRKPPSFFSERVRALPPGRVFAAISEGYGLMPSYASRFSAAERWEIVGYVQALQLSRSLRATDLPPALQRELRRETEER